MNAFDTPPYGLPFLDNYLTVAKTKNCVVTCKVNLAVQTELIKKRGSLAIGDNSTGVVLFPLKGDPLNTLSLEVDSEKALDSHFSISVS
jgi:hypothetical protein